MGLLDRSIFDDVIYLLEAMPTEAEAAAGGERVKNELRLRFCFVCW